MEIDLSNPVGKRAWIKRRNDWVMRQLDKKINIVFESLMPPDVSQDTCIYFAIIMLGLLPLHAIIGIFLSNASKARNQAQADKVWRDSIAFIAALGPLIYALRIGRGRPKILSFVKPWQIPCGYIHIIDLEPNELRLLFAEAKQVQDIETYRRGGMEIYKYKPAETDPGEINNAKSALFETAWTEVVKALRCTLPIQGCSKAKAEKILAELEAHKNEALPDYVKTMQHIYATMPEYIRMESELRKSLARIVPEQACALFEESVTFPHVLDIYQLVKTRAMHSCWQLHSASGIPTNCAA